MTTSENTPELSLPTRSDLEDLLAHNFEKLVSLAGAISHRRDRAWSEDVVQSVALEIVQKINEGEPFLDTSLWKYFCWKIRNRSVIASRRRELQLLQDRAVGFEDADAIDLLAQIPDDALSPHEVALDRERLESRKKLLSDVLEAYCRHCESQPRMLAGKEILERMLRGESPEQTAAAMGKKRNTVDKARRDARLKLRALMEKHDVHHSVFATFFRREMDHPFQGERNNTRALDVQSTSEIFGWIMDQAGAFCPPEKRLRRFLENPEDALLRDVRYHVAEAGCPLCRGVIEAWESDERVYPGAARAGEAASRGFGEARADAVPPIVVEASKAFQTELPDLRREYADMWVAYRGAARLGVAPSKTQLYNQCLAQGLSPNEFCIWCVAIGPDTNKIVTVREV